MITITQTMPFCLSMNRTRNGINIKGVNAVTMRNRRAFCVAAIDRYVPVFGFFWHVLRVNFFYASELNGGGRQIIFRYFSEQAERRFVRVVLATRSKFLRRVISRSIYISFRLLISWFRVNQLYFQVSLTTMLFRRRFNSFLVCINQMVTINGSVVDPFRRPRLFLFNFFIFPFRNFCSRVRLN